jgi:hypothetical protein
VSQTDAAVAMPAISTGMLMAVTPVSDWRRERFRVERDLSSSLIVQGNTCATFELGRKLTQRSAEGQ